MNLAELAKKAAALPDLDFNWGGPEQWHPDVFKREVKTLPDAIKYIEQLRQRMGEYALALHDLTEAYKQLRDVILEADVHS